MKILVLTNNDIGLYNFRKELLEELLKRENQILIALPEGVRIADLTKLGCKFYPINIDRRGKNPFKDIILFKVYFQLIKAYLPDIILTYTIKPNIYGGIAATLNRKPYIINITGLGSALENNGLIKSLILFLYKMAVQNAKCVFFQNRENYQFFLKNKIHISNPRFLPGSGVNLKYNKFEEYPEEGETLLFLFIGRIMKEKGVEELLTAFGQLKKEHQDISCILIGNYEEDYRKMIESLDQRGVIQYVGFQNDVRPYIKRCWAVIQPSYHEGLSNVLLEAAAAGRPVLASKIPGCQEAFDEGITGFGFKPQNTISLRETILKFIQIPYQRKKEMGLAARKKMEREFDRKVVIEAYLDEIQRIQ